MSFTYNGTRRAGPGGAYAFFAGRDATRGFVTGEFGADLSDDVADFTAEQHAEAVRWRDFYQNHKVRHRPAFGGCPRGAVHGAAARRAGQACS
jgi:hypothetical protein